jgi:putative membrane protein
MSSLFAFLHFIAAFALVGALSAQLILLGQEISASVIRRLRVADAVYGVSATLVAAAGLLRVFYFEKGAAYYFFNAAFLAKLALFVLVGVLSIYPTLKFSSWHRAVKAGAAPQVEAQTLGALRTTLRLELAGVALLVLCASLMAHGVGGLH